MIVRQVHTQEENSAALCDSFVAPIKCHMGVHGRRISGVQSSIGRSQFFEKFRRQQTSRLEPTAKQLV